jgi:hypothetical protein
MEFPPLGKKLVLLVADQLHGAPQIVGLHIFSPNKSWRTVRPDQVDLGMTIPEHMHMGWFMVVCEDDDAQPMRSIDRDHAEE